MIANKRIIGITGRAGAGKNTAAEALCEYEEVAFVKPLKDAVKILFNFTDEQLHDTKLKEVIDPRWGKSPRQILQWLGTDCLRSEINEHFFLLHMENKIQHLKSDNVVITDVRFDNEAKFIKERGGKIVKITRGEEKEDKEAHSSEKGVSDEFIDEIIANDGTIEELFKKMVFFEEQVFDSKSKRVKEECSCDR